MRNEMNYIVHVLFHNRREVSAGLTVAEEGALESTLLHSASLPPPITSMDARLDPVTMSQKQYDTIADSVDINKPGNDNQPLQCLPDFVVQKNLMLLVRSPPSSAVGFDSGELPKNGGNKNNNGRSPDLKQKKPVANLVPEENSKTIPEKWKQEQERIRAGIVDVMQHKQHKYQFDATQKIILSNKSK
ncbi:alcohol dehydrogenase [Actinidia chinensis var. chinensis]|uniref:Alcohol dehydrogenase n=1 Tax=Actinidia chinensis var. chinensis TaxID=1590841 RepID=A0A2R6QYK6_ACTCC|nr:alcohol dehydrogenase [Actinidia chinensis var. chinensis]